MHNGTAILVRCLAVLSATPGVLAGQKRNATVDTSAVSGFQASWEAPDRLVSRSITTRFAPLQVSGLRDIADYFLLAEVFDIDQITPGEGVRGVVSASLRPLRPEGIGDPLWSVEARGSEGALLSGDRLYRVTDIGCCSAESTHTYFSVLTGSEVFSGNGSLLRISTPLGARFVSFHGSNASVRLAERERDSTVVGVLYYGDNRSPASRLVLTDAQGIVYGVRKVTLLVDGSETQEHRIWRWIVPNAPVNADPGLIGGFSIVLELQPMDSDDFAPARIEIPIASDSFALDRVDLPRRLQIRGGGDDGRR